MILINGALLSKKIKETIKNEISLNNYNPGLAVIIVGEDKSSNKYVNMKSISCKDVGINSYIHRLSENISENELIEVIKSINTNSEIDGILVQLPLPKHINQNKILKTVSIDKDVDGFNPYNIGCLTAGIDEGFTPCTPLGVMELFKEYNIELEGKNICMIGASNIVGKPMASLLINNSATVTVIQQSVVDLKSFTKNADIIIVATGVINLITEDMVKKGVIIIDIGINVSDNGSLVGDCDFEGLKDKASMITPVPGGVGPMTIAMLLSNTLIAFKRRNELDDKNNG